MLSGSAEGATICAAPELCSDSSGAGLCVTVGVDLTCNGGVAGNQVGKDGTLTEHSREPLHGVVEGEKGCGRWASMMTSAVSLVGVCVAAALEVESTMATLVAGNDADGAEGTMCGGEACEDRAGTLSAAGRKQSSLKP